MSNNTFETYSPQYENISKRLNRLKYNSQSALNPSSNIRSNSVSRKIDIVNPSQTKQNNYRSRQRLSPSLLEESIQPDRMNGRVTKNTGLKKYNQRQLKEVLDSRIIKNITNQQPYSPSNKLQYSRIYKQTRGIDTIIYQDSPRMQSIQKQQKKKNKFQGKLIPGKVYTKSYLMSLI